MLEPSPFSVLGPFLCLSVDLPTPYLLHDTAGHLSYPMTPIGSSYILLVHIYAAHMQH